MRQLRWILVGLAVAIPGSMAWAVPVAVTYAFDSTNATLSITSPAVINIPPQGTIEGLIQVTYTGTAPEEILDGPATLDIFSLSADLDIATVLFGLPVTLEGPLDADLVDPADGTLTGNTLDFGGASGLFHAAGSIVCGGTLCSVVGFTPGVPRDFDGTASVPLPLMTVASLHGTLTGLQFDIGGVAILANLTFDAPETGREVVPEPATALLLGLAGALALARRR